MNQVEQIGIESLLNRARAIWGPEKMDLRDIIVRLNVGLGDIARVARGASKDRVARPSDEAQRNELKKELGNLIFSSIRFCDDLGFSPSVCVDLAVEAQNKFARENPQR